MFNADLFLLIIKHQFARRIDNQFIQIFNRFLAFHIKRTDRIDLVTPHLDADRIVLRQWKYI